MTTSRKQQKSRKRMLREWRRYNLCCRKMWSNSLVKYTYTDSIRLAHTWCRPSSLEAQQRCAQISWAESARRAWRANTYSTRAGSRRESSRRFPQPVRWREASTPHNRTQWSGSGGADTPCRGRCQSDDRSSPVEVMVLAPPHWEVGKEWGPGSY